MFNSTFLKFLFTFVVIVGTSFLIMSIAGSLDSKSSANKSTQAIILK